MDPAWPTSERHLRRADGDTSYISHVFRATGDPKHHVGLISMYRHTYVAFSTRLPSTGLKQFGTALFLSPSLVLELPWRERPNTVGVIKSLRRSWYIVCQCQESAAETSGRECRRAICAIQASLHLCMTSRCSIYHEQSSEYVTPSLRQSSRSRHALAHMA